MNKAVYQYLDKTIEFAIIDVPSDQTIVQPLTFPEAHHIWRAVCATEHLGETVDTKNIPVILSMISAIIENGYDTYCTICGKKSKHPYCGQDCYDRYSVQATDNTVTDNYRHDATCVLLLIKTAILCAKSARGASVFQPFPTAYKNCEYLSQKMAQYNEKNFRHAAENSSNDLELCSKIGDDLYGIIKFVVLTNRTYIRSEKIAQNAELFRETEDVLEINAETKFMIFQIVHDSVTEEKFKTDKPQYLVHGSGLGNWYSIMRNGLRNYSGTALMSAGAVHGHGVYLSDAVKFSYGYAAPSDGLSIIGVVQIAEPEKYKKATNIYVVPEEDKILLRYLILTNGQHLDAVQEYVMGKRIAELQAFNNNIPYIITKRLAQEMKYVEQLPMKHPFLSGLVLDGTDREWTIRFGNWELFIQIPHNYPNMPPTIACKGEFRQNIYVRDGHVCLPELSLLQWNSKTRIADIILRLSRVIGDTTVVQKIIAEN